MKLFRILAIAVVLPVSALAEQVSDAATDPAPEALSETLAEPTVGPYEAAKTGKLDQFIWLRRPVVVFADTPNDPNFRRQMQNIEADLASLDDRDVVVIIDTDPAARSEVRQQLRPRGFSLVLMDKGGEVMRRLPSAWTMREIVNAIDRFPMRRQEMLERNPAGR